MANSKEPLRKLRKKQNQALDKYSEAVRSSLSKLDRLKFKAIVVIEIHARDVIEKMYRASESNSIFIYPTFFSSFFHLYFSSALFSGFLSQKIHWTRAERNRQITNFIRIMQGTPYHVSALYRWLYMIRCVYI